MSPKSPALNNKYTKIEVESIPVGYTRTLSFLANQTLVKPKITAKISRMTSKMSKS